MSMAGMWCPPLHPISDDHGCRPIAVHTRGVSQAVTCRLQFCAYSAGLGAVQNNYIL